MNKLNILLLTLNPQTSNEIDAYHLNNNSTLYCIRINNEPRYTFKIRDIDRIKGTLSNGSTFIGLVALCR
jgi:hypothetical protein